MSKPLRIFSESYIPQSRTWSDTVQLLRFEDEWQASGRGRLYVALRNARKANHIARSADAIYFGDTQPWSISLAIIFLSLRRKRPTILRADPLMRYPNRRWKVWFHRQWMHGTDKLIVWAPPVVQRYHRVYGFPITRMQAFYFHHTLAGYDVQVREDDYVFSGGDSLRDYATLFRAVEGMDIRVVVATRLRIEEFRVPHNVQIVSCSHAEFRSLMAGAKFVVLPLDMSRLATTGQQSYLNAMALGKLVIVTDTVDAPFYIEDGKTGLLTPCGDVQALRKAIAWALENPNERRHIGQRAKVFAEPMDTEWWCRKILELVIEVHEGRTG